MNREDTECRNCGHVYLKEENHFQHDCKNPLTEQSDKSGETRQEFTTRMVAEFIRMVESGSSITLDSASRRMVESMARIRIDEILDRKMRWADGVDF